MSTVRQRTRTLLCAILCVTTGCMSGQTVRVTAHLPAPDPAVELAVSYDGVPNSIKMTRSGPMDAYAVVPLGRGYDHQLKVTGKGYETVERGLRSTFSGSWLGLSILWWIFVPLGILSMPVDIATGGAQSELQPEEIHVDLARDQAAPAPVAPAEVAPKAAVTPAARPASCSGCGTQFQSNDQRFCPSCGAKRQEKTP